MVFLVTDLLTIAFPVAAFFLWREWHKFNGTVADNYANGCLYAAIAIITVVVLGRYLIAPILSKRRKGEDEPGILKAKKGEFAKRPDGSTINIEYQGRDGGQPIIFVHGLNANSKNWYYQRKYFEKDYRLIMMDLPGMGKSTRPSNKNFSLDNLSADLKTVIDHTGVKDVILWGHSLGGMTILNLLGKVKEARELPIKGVILQHTTYTNPVRTILFRRLMTALQRPVLTPLCYLIIFFSPFIWIVRWMSYLNGNAHLMNRFLTFAGSQTPKQLDFTTLLSTMTPPSVLARGCLGMFRYDATKQLPDIALPTLIIAANHDLLTQPDASSYMKKHIPNSELQTVSPANHQGLIERHFEVNEVAERFMNKLR
jgi:pimeloyl-ACP methyl ester carboxylesterase